jgi:hypothetical protein
MRRFTVVAIGIGLMGLLPLSAEARHGCSRVFVTSTPATQQTGFSAAEVLDLHFQAAFHPPSKRHPLPETLAVRIFTPNGHLYQKMTVPVVAEESTQRHRKVKGYRFPQATRRARGYSDRGTRWSVVDIPPFAVAGTSIVSSSLYGVWRVEITAGDGAESCEARFEIRQ